MNTVAKRYCLEDLLYLMERLRDPANGCPWDIKQSNETIAASTIEEAYEVVDAIEQQQTDQLREELGDLLFQIVFYSQMAREEGAFDFNVVVDGITQKLIHRHPHVFPDGSLTSISPIKTRDQHSIATQWEALKAEERKAKGHTGLLDDIPVALPATTRAAKLQKRAANVGFDWQNIEDVFAKVEEELDEVKEAVSSGDSVHVEEELGDLLFMVVNTCRHLKADPETVLRRANRKFERRFAHIERQVTQTGGDWDEYSLEQLDSLWNEAKRQESH